MMKRWELIDEIHALYNKINELQILLDNALKKNNRQVSKVGKWVADRYCSECEWDKQEASYTSGWRENYCPNCGARIEVDG